MVDYLLGLLLIGLGIHNPLQDVPTSQTSQVAVLGDEDESDSVNDHDENDSDDDDHDEVEKDDDHDENDSDDDDHDEAEKDDEKKGVKNRRFNRTKVSNVRAYDGVRSEHDEDEVESEDEDEDESEDESDRHSRREELRDLLESRREAFKKRVQDAREKAKEEYEEKREEFREKLETIQDENKQEVVERLDVNISEMNEKRTERMTEQLNAIDEVLSRVIDKISERADEGEDTTRLDEAVGVAQTTIAAARSSVEAQASVDYIIDITSEDNLGAMVQEQIQTLRGDLGEVYTQIRQAHAAVRDVIVVYAQRDRANDQQNETVTEDL